MKKGYILSEPLCFLQVRGSQLEQFCPQGHLEMSENILVVTPGVGVATSGSRPEIWLTTLQCTGCLP